jgi:hypothetical protein
MPRFPPLQLHLQSLLAYGPTVINYLRLRASSPGSLDGSFCRGMLPRPMKDSMNWRFLRVKPLEPLFSPEIVGSKSNVFHFGRLLPPYLCSKFSKVSKHCVLLHSHYSTCVKCKCNFSPCYLVARNSSSRSEEQGREIETGCS